MKVLRSLGISLIAVLAWPQLAGAQHHTPLPHPVGAPGQIHSNASQAGSQWTPLTNQPDFLLDGAANPILLTDGTVLVQDAGFPDWWRLTPDNKGSYVNGTWTQIASLPCWIQPALSLVCRTAGRPADH